MSIITEMQNSWVKKENMKKQFLIISIVQKRKKLLNTSKICVCVCVCVCVYLFIYFNFVPIHTFLPPPQPLPLANTNMFSASVSFSVCLICCCCCYFGFWFFDSTCKLDHRVFTFLCQTYFSQHNALKVHPCCCKWQEFIVFYG